MIALAQTQQHPKSNAFEGLREPVLDRVGAVEILDDFLQHDGQAEGHEDLVRMGALVEVLDQAALHDEADSDHDRDREQDCDRHRPVDYGTPTSGPNQLSI